jgi:hypothetical protein
MTYPKNYKGKKIALPELPKKKRTPLNDYYIYRNIEISKLTPKKTKTIRGGMAKGN